MKQWLSLLLIALAFLLLAGCGTSVDLNQPPEILYGEDVCDQCGMIVSDPRFAAAYVTMDEQIRLFDDMGGMFAYDQEHHEAVHAYWVHDYHTEDWVRADKATYVFQQGLVTPMGWGLAAFSTEDSAQTFVREKGGTITTFASIHEAIASGVLDPAGLSDHAHDDMDMDMDHDQMEDS